MGAGTTPTERAMEAFVAELVRWRSDRGLSKKQLANEMGFDPSYVSHIEGRRHRPTEDFAKRAEAVLRTGGAIWRRYQEYDEVRHSRVPGRDPPVPEQWFPPGTGLVVEHDDAELVQAGGAYRITVRRRLYNAGTEPVTRYLVRVAVDKFPGEPVRSNRYYREHPLTWEELGLAATSGGEPMDWRAEHDRDSFKEIWLLFENAHGRFPLYPGQRTEIAYSYTVGEDKWGQWFQRAVRLPTRRLSIRLVFPRGEEPAVWGVESSLTAESVPLRTPVGRRIDGDRVIFDWATDDPPLHARYRLEWRYRGGQRLPPAPAVELAATALASDKMRAAGIVQRGAEILRQSAQPFDLPRQAALAREVVDTIQSAIDRVHQVHAFGKGMGLAAPQLGLGWAAAVVRPPDPDTAPIVLLNPRIVAESAETDERYEGCLSFFDVRGTVPRPLHLEVAHETVDGEAVITAFDRAVARLVAHEVDHLFGRLYTDHMPTGARLIPVEEYGEVGRPWRY